MDEKKKEILMVRQTQHTAHSINGTQHKRHKQHTTNNTHLEGAADELELAKEAAARGLDLLGGLAQDAAGIAE